ncbi:hypothetical protein K505DRAFT_383435 [Melanomma pulvis-pyrius CBS 109.77]|uniref:Uncharacterized protein n=1 Tax=Melanomma pulvis-pyrius CBS 109.77 TaxID=1314802 RepID=A0A6A6WN10_9PLEO|nr:hypothetical protein K505DRAFT_383435 [Melanomma pulvis-pyrius CBS 109.77]
MARGCSGRRHKVPGCHDGRRPVNGRRIHCGPIHHPSQTHHCSPITAAPSLADTCQAGPSPAAENVCRLIWSGRASASPPAQMSGLPLAIGVFPTAAARDPLHSPRTTLPGFARILHRGASRGAVHRSCPESASTRRRPNRAAGCAARISGRLPGHHTAVVVQPGDFDVR